MSKYSRLVKYSETTYTIIWEKLYSHTSQSVHITHHLNFHASTTSIAFVSRHNIPSWSTGGFDFAFFRIDAATGATVHDAFGIGANVGNNEENHNVFYKDADGSAFVSYFATTFFWLARINLATSTTAWAKKTDIGVDNSVYEGCRYFFYDESTSKLYATSNYQTIYFFVCVFTDTGTLESCIRMGSGIGEFPYFMSLNANFLFIMGSSLSWKTTGSTRGTFAINLNMQQLDDTCETLNLQTAIVTWTDDSSGFPLYGISTTDVAVDNYVSSGSSNSVGTPTSTMARICEFFENALDNLPTLPSAGTASISTLVGPTTITAGMSVTYEVTLLGSDSLPSWASFNPATRTFEATFPNLNATYTF